jgi:hypothetical protein
VHWKEAFGSMAADHLTERHIDLYLKQSGRAPGTLQVELANLRQAFKIAQRKKLLASIPHIPTLKFNNPGSRGLTVLGAFLG